MSAQGSAASEPREGSASKARLRAWLQMLKLTRRMEAELRERLRREFGWTLPRFDVMAALYRAEAGMRMSELAGALVVSNGNVTALVDGLVVDGLVVRVPVAEDRRAAIVRLTQRGRERFADMARVHEGWIDDLLGGLDAAQAEALAGLVADARRAREPRP
jgi:DNA-binding MarR family transcriptional regulator